MSTEKFEKLLISEMSKPLTPYERELMCRSHEQDACAETQDGPTFAPDILIAAADAIGDRARERDTPDGERVMRRTVAMFNAWRSGDSLHDVTEAEGWIFMALLKLCRANGGAHKLDDYVDGAAYIALAGEHADRLDESAY